MAKKVNADGSEVSVGYGTQHARGGRGGRQEGGKGGVARNLGPKPIPTMNDPWVRWARLIGVLFVSATVLALLGAGITGCTVAPSRQIIDTQGVDVAKYYQDKAECEAYTEQVDAGASTLDGAAGGALMGAIIGGLIGGRDGALFGAKVFAVTGAAEGAGSAARDQEQVAARCMAGRGYRVLR